ncbi:MAG: S-adenosylmethionine decarboxylase proenzyme [Candidatus Marinimicrobia bacterium]|nr:S-adenosylmethionine decarboxylase proenzyme [Candidatus Neomarinimicrobiota bacterium]
MQSLGRQILAEFYDCDSEILNNVELIEKYMVEACNEAEATIVKTVFHEFSPHGVSGVVVIAESHVAIHTWPEYNYAAVDVFTCGDTISPWTIYKYLENKLRSKTSSMMELRRGLFDDVYQKVYHKPQESVAVEVK